MSRGGKITARSVAMKVLMRVEGGDAFADIVLGKEIGSLEGPDRALATELVYGVLRWREKVDWIIGSFSKVRIKKMEHAVLTALRLGVYQLLFLRGVPARAAVNETVELVKGEGRKTAGFVNAVLRMVDRDRHAVVFPVLKREPVKYISVVFSHPQWIVKRWIERLGLKEALALCQANLLVPPTTVRANTLRNTREELAGLLTDEGYSVKETQFSPYGLVVEKGGEGLPPISTLRDGRFYIQDEGSQLVSLLVAPKAGETVLDACAAPGGKATQMAEMMGNSGRVIAMDRRRGRLMPVVETARRLGIDIIETVEGDSTTDLDFQLSLFPDVANISDGGFDAVLVDAPCTGLGVVGRNPDIKYKRVEADIERLAETQSRLLHNLAGYVRPGGRLVYSVCTFEEEETDGVIEEFLEKHGDFEVEDASKFIPEGPGVVVGEDGFLRTFPHTHSMDGFFAARLRRALLD